MKRLIKKFSKDEQGSSMAEFSLSFPMLAVLTVGSIYLSMSYSQKAIMNGYAFMSARESIVSHNNGEIAKLAGNRYISQTDNKQKWLNQTKIDVNNQGNNIQIIVKKPAQNIDLLSNALSVIGGGKSFTREGAKEITSVITLQNEYVPARNDGTRPKTTTTVNYNTTWLGEELIREKLLAPMPGPIKKVVENRLYENNKRKTLVDSNPEHALSTNAWKNMDKVTENYKYWGIESNLPRISEKPSGSSRLNTLKLTAEYIKFIESGGDILEIATKWIDATVLPGGILEGLEQVAAEGLSVVETSSDWFANEVESNNSRMFK